MTVWRSGLFSSYFLTEGVRELNGYADITSDQLATFEATLIERFDALRAMHKPNEAQTERDLIDRVLDALGWRDRYSVQTPMQRGRVDVPDYLLFADPAADLPPSEWSKISVILDHEGVWKWARGTIRRRLSASCVRLRSC